MVKFLFNNYYKYFRVIKYILAGGTATVVNLILLYFLTEFFQLWYLISSAIAFIISFFVSFYLQKFWTFQDKDKKKIYQQIRLYGIVALANLGLNTGLMYFSVDILKIWYLLAQILISGLIAIESFLIYKFLIFNKHQVRADSLKQNQSLKVLIATGIYPPEIGGPATMLEALAISLIERGIEVKVITYSANSKNRSSESARAFLDVHRISQTKLKFFNKIKYFWRLLELASWADVIYSTDTYSVGYFTYLIKKLFGRKYIIRFAGDSAWETAVGAGWTEDYIVDFIVRKYDKRIEKLKERREKILVNADAVIVVSNFLAEIAKKIGVSGEKIRLIYNSVDFERPENVSQAPIRDWRKGFGQKSKIIMTACRLTPWKGVDGIIKILPELEKKLNDVYLLILGVGPESVNLQKLALELKVTDRVHFLGKIDNRQVIDYFKMADLFILNSNYEGFSHTLLEAMTAGVPIITTNIGGNPELIADGREGLLVNYNNQAELLEAAYRILSDSSLANRLLINAKEKLKIFKWEITLQQTLETITNIVYGKSHSDKSAL